MWKNSPTASCSGSYFMHGLVLTYFSSSFVAWAISHRVIVEMQRSVWPQGHTETYRKSQLSICISFFCVCFNNLPVHAEFIAQESRSILFPVWASQRLHISASPVQKSVSCFHARPDSEIHFHRRWAALSLLSSEHALLLLYICSPEF